MKNFPISEKAIRMAGGSDVINEIVSIENHFIAFLFIKSYFRFFKPEGSNPVSKQATPLANIPKARVGLLPNLSFTKTPHI